MIKTNYLSRGQLAVIIMNIKNNALETKKQWIEPEVAEIEINIISFFLAS